MYGLVSPSFAGDQVLPRSVERKQPAAVPAKKIGSPSVAGAASASTVPPQPRMGVITSHRPPRVVSVPLRPLRGPGNWMMLSEVMRAEGGRSGVDRRIALGGQHQR